MKQITTTENKTYEVPDAVGLLIDKCHLTVNFMANHSASQGRPIIAEQQAYNEHAFLRGSEGHYFVEHYYRGQMYPAVYSVNYEAPEVIEVTEEEYQKWLKK